MSLVGEGNLPRARESAVSRINNNQPVVIIYPLPPTVQKKEKRSGGTLENLPQSLTRAESVRVEWLFIWPNVVLTGAWVQMTTNTNNFKRDKRGDLMDFPPSTMAAMLKSMELETGLTRVLSQFCSPENVVWLGLAKPYCNPLMFESGSPSQSPAVPTEKAEKESPMYYALLLVNLLTCLYENAYTGALGSTGRCSSFNVNQLREQVPVRYADVPIGQDRQGSICLVRYSCSQQLFNWAWPRNQPVDPNSIELPPPLVQENPMWNGERLAQLREVMEQERDHESIFLKACLKVLATPPWALLDFILSPGDIRKVDPRGTVLSRPHWARFLDRKANVARKMVAAYGLGSYIPFPGYVPGAKETAVQLKDIFSVPNALRLFYRYVSPYSRLFDSQDHPMVNEIMFVARFYLPWEQLPQETRLRQANELATLIREELQERQQMDPEGEELQLRRRVVGDDGLLLRKLREASEQILAEEKGRLEFVQGKPSSDCIYLKWYQTAQRVAEAIHSGRFPEFQPFASLFYLFDAHNFQNGDPSRMARGPLLETKFEHMRDERIFIQSETKRAFERATQNDQTFGEFQRRMARQVYPLLNLLNATHYEVPIDDGKKLYDRSSFFLLQPHPFTVRTKNADLSPKDDLLAVISDLLVRMGIVDARPEILRWVEFYLESPSAREDVRIILAMGGTGAGKTWFLNLLLRFMGEKSGSVSTSETDKAAFYAVSRLFFSQLLDEFARNSDKDKSKSGPDTSLR